MYLVLVSLRSPGDLVHHGPEEDAVVEADVEVELALDPGLSVPALGAAHLADAERHGTVWQGLHGEWGEAVL